jgi:hypothetical protein
MPRLWRAGEPGSAILPGNVLIPPAAGRAVAWTGRPGVSGGAHPRTHLRERSALANSLDLNLQFHFLLEPELLAEVDTEVTAVERRRCISAAHFLL